MPNSEQPEKPDSGAGWHTLKVDEVVSRLETDPEQGLSAEEAAGRLKEFGPNRLESRGGRSPLAMLASQFKETMVLLLLGAGAVSYLVGDITDTVVILAIVVLNSALSFFQEYRAEQALEALKTLAVPEVKVVRDGEVRKLEATEVVPGDVIQLEAGGSVPADARLLEAINLKIEESPLTGESVPVEKQVEALPDAGAPLGDRSNMVYRGTTASYGRGKAVVVTTGMSTELGRIAQLIQEVEQEDTILERRMDQLGKRLVLAALLLVALVFALGLLRGFGLTEMLLTAITLAVAAVPEGLPAVVTISLALGAWRMARRNALIRRLPAVETLGSVTTICSDKTGTLTQNRMAVTILDVAGDRFDLTEADRLPDTHGGLYRLLLMGGALCNDAQVSKRASEILGDPTEAALVAVAGRFDLEKAELEEHMPRVREIPFSSERKRMLTVHEIPQEERDNLPLMADRPFAVFCKGAVDSLLQVSASVLHANSREPLNQDWVERIEKANAELASGGSRVLALAVKGLDSKTEQSDDQLERELCFVGMVAMSDPLRPEAIGAVEVARRAGIRTLMITGDHPLTAKAIAGQLGLYRAGDPVLTGRELQGFSFGELESQVRDVSVFARVSPEHKLRIVEALQSGGEIAAVTGDGVNDAPALKRADIGVAMGISGTDVAKEAADAVLLDDNFATIVAAVEEGRTIYDNIRKFIKYLITTNLGELWTMLLGLLAGLPVPLLPLQILWINLVTDGLPALALGVEPAEPDLMQRPPREPGENIFARGLGRHVMWVGLLMGLLTFSAQYYCVSSGVEHWQTLVFTTLALAQMAHVMAIRSESQSLFTQGVFSNVWMALAVGATLLLQMAVVYWPPLQRIFKTQPLTAMELVASMGLALVIFVAVELEKWWKRRRAPEETPPAA